MQVLSPITSKVIGAKEVRVGNDRVAITRLSVRVVSGLQLTISPDTAIENGYVAETSVTRKLTAQYQVYTHTHTHPHPRFFLKNEWTRRTCFSIVRSI